MNKLSLSILLFSEISREDTDETDIYTVVYIKLFLCSMRAIHWLTLSGLGGQYCPLTIERLSSKNYLSQWQFLNMYILWLQTKTLVICTLTGVLRGVSNLPVKIVCAYFWKYLLLKKVLFIFYNVRCIDIFIFDQWFNFCGKTKFEAIFWLRFTGHFISRASERRSACTQF